MKSLQRLLLFLTVLVSLVCFYFHYFLMLILSIDSFFFFFLLVIQAKAIWNDGDNAQANIDWVLFSTLSFF